MYYVFKGRMWYLLHNVVAYLCPLWLHCTQLLSLWMHLEKFKIEITLVQCYAHWRFCATPRPSLGRKSMGQLVQSCFTRDNVCLTIVSLLLNMFYSFKTLIDLLSLCVLEINGKQRRSYLSCSFHHLISENFKKGIAFASIKKKWGKISS